MNSYEVLQDFNDTNSGLIDKEDVQKQQDTFSKRYLCDMIVDHFPSRFSLYMFDDAGLDNFSSDHAKDLMKKLSSIIPYHILFGKVSNWLQILENVKSFLKKMCDLADSISEDSDFDFDSMSKRVERFLNTEYEVYDVDYDTIKKLVDMVILLI